MRASILRALALVVCASACGPPAGGWDPVTLRLVIRAGTSPDALGGPHPVTALLGEVQTDSPAGNVALALDWRVEEGLVHGTPVLDGLAPGGPVRLKLWGVAHDGETRRSVGRSMPFVLPESGEVTVPIFLGVLDAWTRTAADPVWAREEGAAVALDDGRVLLVGGHWGGEPVPPAIYRHDTGAVAWVDGPAPQVLAPSVVATEEGALVAGGRDPSGEVTGEVWHFDGEAFTRLDPVVHAHAGGGAVWIEAAETALFVGGLAGDSAVADVSAIRLTAEGAEVLASVAILEEARGHPEVTFLGGLAEPWILVTGGVPNLVDPALETAEVVRLDASGDVSVSFVESADSPARAGLEIGRVGHRVVSFGRGQALIVGGAGRAFGAPHPDPVPLVYDPGMGSDGGFLSASAESMPACAGGVGGRLLDGGILLAGGACQTAEGLAPSGATHLVRPAAVPGDDGLHPLAVEVRTAASPRRDAAFVTLSDGSHLVAGGVGADGEAVDFAEIFVPCADAEEACDAL